MLARRCWRQTLQSSLLRARSVAVPVRCLQGVPRVATQQSLSLVRCNPVSGVLCRVLSTHTSASVTASSSSTKRGDAGHPPSGLRVHFGEQLADFRVVDMEAYNMQALTTDVARHWKLSPDLVVLPCPLPSF